jgi:hypothetical protein
MTINAVCDIGFIPIRKEQTSATEMLSCLVFGEVYEILESKDNWHYIKTRFDSYKGWIYSKGPYKVSEEFVHQWETEERYYSFDLFQQVSVNGHCRYVGFGSVLPLYNQHQFNLDVNSCMVSGAVFRENKTLGRDFILKQAERLLGLPYLWGGRNTFGIDCSGMTQTLYKLIGVYLPRDSYQQEKVGVEVPFEKHRKGDLAFFTNGRISHVGLLDGEGFILHASGMVRKDPFDEKGIFNRGIDKYTHKLECIKRVIK